MHRRIITAGLLFVCTTALAEEKLEDVKKKIVERATKHNSVQYTMKVTSDMSQHGMVMKSDSTSHIKYMKKDGKLLSRREMTATTTTKAGEVDQKYETKALIVVDGSFQWSFSEAMGQKNATKMKIPKEHEKSLSPAAGWERFDLKVLPDETIDGRKCWVLELTPKDAATKTQISKSVAYYCQKTGLAVKNVGYNPSGEAFSTMTMTDIKINEKIDPKAPEGVTVTDRTGAPQG